MQGEHSGGVKYVLGKSAATSALIAGFIATHVATVFGLWFGAAKMPQFDFNTLNGWLILGFTRPAETTFLVGGLVHYVNGILWGLIFGLIVYPMMGGSLKMLAPMKPTTNLLKGLLWGWTLWLISSILWMTLLVGPLVNAFGGVGPFLTNFGPVGYQAVFTNLFWHTIYGLHIGLFFNPMKAGSSTPTWR